MSNYPDNFSALAFAHAYPDPTLDAYVQVEVDEARRLADHIDEQVLPDFKGYTDLTAMIDEFTGALRSKCIEIEEQES